MTTTPHRLRPLAPARSTRWRPLRVLPAACVLLLADHATGQPAGGPTDDSNLPPGTTLVDTAIFSDLEPYGAQAARSVTTHPVYTDEDGNQRRALRIQNFGGIADDWDVQTGQPTTAPVQEGDTALASFDARCIESMSGEATLKFAFERSGPPYDKSAYAQFRVGADWKRFHVPFTAADDFAAGEATVVFHVGFNHQALELANLEVTRFGPGVALEDLPVTRLTYPGREADAPWRAVAAERIEEHRKGALRVSVRDADGRPVPDAEVRVTLQRHAFPFGTAVAVDALLAEGPDGDRYREVLAGWFNAGVFENATKWQNHGAATEEETLRSLEWLDAHEIRMRGHVLVWPGWKWIPEGVHAIREDLTRLRRVVEARVVDTASTYRGRFGDWDVLNEPFNNHDLMDLLGQDVQVDWFHLAHAADPEARLYLNDWGILTTGEQRTTHQQHFEDTARFLLDRGAPLQGLGMQGHFGGSLSSPEQLWGTLDRFAALGLPIKVTEFDLDLPDEELQADYMRDAMTAFFAHPSVEGFTMWGFWASKHWSPQAALFDEHWNERPVGRAWHDLVHGAWRTDESAVTDSEGNAEVRGFFGEYLVEVSEGGVTQTRSFHLTPEASDLGVTVD